MMAMFDGYLDANAHDYAARCKTWQRLERRCSRQTCRPIARRLPVAPSPSPDCCAVPVCIAWSG